MYTRLLASRRQCQTRPLSVAPNVEAKRSSPETAGDLHISNYTILNTFKLHPRRMWLFSRRLNVLNLLSVMNSTIRKIQSMTWTCFPTSNTLKTLPTQSLNHRYLLCRAWKPTPAPALRWAITLQSHGNAPLRVALGRTYKTIPTTHWRHVKSTHISSVESRRRAWRRTISHSSGSGLPSFGPGWNWTKGPDPAQEPPSDPTRIALAGCHADQT